MKTIDILTYELYQQIMKYLIKKSTSLKCFAGNDFCKISFPLLLCRVSIIYIFDEPCHKQSFRKKLGKMHFAKKAFNRSYSVRKNEG